MKLSRLSRLITYNFISLLFSWNLVFSITYSMNFEVSKQAVLKYCLLTMFLLNIFFINRITIISGTCLAVCMALYHGYTMMKLKLFEKFFATAKEFFIWLYEYIKGYQYLNDSFSIYMTIILVLMVCGWVFVFILKRYHFYFLMAGGLIYYIVCINMGLRIYDAGLYIYLFCMISLFGREVFNKRTKHMLSTASQHLGYIYVLWAMPIALFIILMVSSVSVEKDYQRPQWLDEGADVFSRWYDNQSWLNDVGQWKGSDFSLVSTGFQPNRSAIGGNIVLDNRQVLNVKSDHRIYLKGSVKDYYTGNSWISKELEEFSIEGSSIEDYITDNYFSDRRLFVEMFKRTRFRRISNQLYNQAFLHGDAQIEQVGFRTNTLFYPDNVIRLLEAKDEDASLIFNSNAEFYFRGETSDDNKYSIQYRVVDRSNPFVEELLRVSDPDAIKAVLEKSDSLKNKYDKMIKKYTVKENITQKVSDLAIQITQDSGNRYDKVKAIEKYLSSNYTYTLTPGDTPEGRDFVEYFLFDSMKGYCTYYASAMTMMVRSLGIPARYVEGYALPAKPGSDGVYKVTNELAHAWVEVFFEGFGWVRFEPTSPFNTLLDTQQEDSQALPADETYSEDYMKSIMGEAEIVLDQGLKEQSIDGRLSFAKEIVKIIISMIALMIGIILLVVIVRRVIFETSIIEIKHQHAKSSVINIYQKILKILRLYHFDMERGETPLEYAKRVDLQFTNGSDSFYGITELYIKAKFSKSPMDDQDKEKLLMFYQSMIKDLKKSLNILSFYYYKYIKLEY